MLVTALLLGSILSALEFTVIASVAPVIVADLGEPDLFAWATTGYMIASTVFTLISGKLCDRLGRKRTFLAGVVLFGLGSIACGFATNMPIFIVSRIVQGLGGGLLVPASSTIVGDVYEGEKRVKMQSVFAAAWGLSAIAGPSLGSYVAFHWQWRWLFFLNVPIVLLIVLITAVALQEKQSSAIHGRFDFRGMLLMCGSLAAFLLVFETEGFVQVISIVCTLLFGTALFLSLRAAQDPIVDLKLMGRRDIRRIYMIAAVMGANTFVAITFLPFVALWGLGFQAKEAGQVLLPLTLGAVIATISCGYLLRALSSRAIMFAGLLGMLIGDALVAMMANSWPDGALYLAAGLIGLGTGFLMPLLSAYVQHGAEWSEKGMLTAFLSFFRSMGGSLGVIIAAFLFKRSLPASFHWDGEFTGLTPEETLTEQASQYSFVMNGVHDVFWLCGLLALVGVSCLLQGTKAAIWKHQKEQGA
ncbi:MFS transporter [Paenibacillus sp. MMS18-CY102]|uniref:MFS transporter n=1 Tax=Paenibacillus sp. MMS18-CY102 TaxID=2682849 RepID=UPI001EFFA603|nr:MFS transporter [Paenibacillus sp. MMS18-CY102]